MASHYSTDAAPADNQAFAQPFDETKAMGRKGELRPDDAKLGDTVVPVDQALDGARGERFGETVDQSSAGRLGASDETVERLASDKADKSKSKEKTKEKPDDSPDPDDEEDKLDDALDDSFPASDPPPIRPGEG
ncbi:hypothetical protein ACFELO_03330 [Oceanicaulis sp. LC35]|uniref:hypothetical protein n=1 Tax=Oceanicaulis sp. LC35 TaxID=3349635 RepID=UPI003F87AB21